MAQPIAGAASSVASIKVKRKLGGSDMLEKRGVELLDHQESLRQEL
jgi:hypothetical protein